jgi:hypothetical protein
MNFTGESALASIAAQGNPMNNLLDPAILFFALGALAGAIKSNLEIPAPISRFLSLYLLMALGLKGGFALAQSGLTVQVASGLACALTLAVVVPVIALQFLRRLVGPYDAAALAATYGSVSAVTFVTAVQFLETRGLPYGGHMAAAMALMESPAIILAVLFANTVRQREPALAVGAAVLAAPAGAGLSMRKVLYESFTDGAQLLLLGAMLVGLLTGESGREAMQPFLQMGRRETVVFSEDSAQVSLPADAPPPPPRAAVAVVQSHTNPHE